MGGTTAESLPAKNAVLVEQSEVEKYRQKAGAQEEPKKPAGASPKKEDPAPKAEGPADSKARSLSKVKLGDTYYYIVTPEEIAFYNQVKERYKDSSKNPFIVYLHSEFLKDLKVQRSKKFFRLTAIVLSSAAGAVLVAASCILIYKSRMLP